MLIEIRGVGFINKGAELMLRAITEKIKKEIPNAGLVMEPCGNQAPYLKRAELGLYQKLWLQRYGIQWGCLGSVIPKQLRQMYGLVLNSEVDVVLDASGFAYSDQWGPETTIIAAKTIKKWKKQGAKVILMPQAFGPFTGEKIKSAFKTIVDHADLIFVRDKVSYNYIKQLVGEQKYIKLAPDFTNLVECQPPIGFNNEANRFCIIPNYRMVDRTSKEQRDAYLPFLINCTKYLLSKGAKPFILIHEGPNDLWIGQEIVKAVGQEINIVQETNALNVKGIIAASEGVISSRFHGLVSALSQGVPALATGWSHKYEMLFKDYEFQEGILSVDSTFEEIKNKIDMLISDISKKQVKKKIINAGKLQKKASSEMWDTVFDYIK